MRSLLAVLLGAALTVVAIAEAWPGRQDVRTDDRNADGRPDVWRRYDSTGLLTRISTDSNFDGRADVEEYYAHGSLVRRESDRNLDDAIDLFEEFDVHTHEQIKSVVDTNYDGIADLLVLFRDGQPVFSSYAHPVSVELRTEWPMSARRVSASSHSTNRELVQLVDPFSEETAIHGSAESESDRPFYVGVSTSGGLPAGSPATVDARVLSVRLPSQNDQHVLLSSIRPRSLRSPPLV